MSLKFLYELLRRFAETAGACGGRGGEGERAHHEPVATAVSMVIERPAAIGAASGTDRSGVADAAAFCSSANRHAKFSPEPSCVYRCRGPSTVEDILQTRHGALW